VDPGSGGLALRDLATGALRLIATKPEGSREFAYFSAISPDSARVAYAWMNHEGFYDLRLVSGAGGAPRVLYRNPEAGFVQPSAWTPDGASVLTLFFRKDNISQIALVSAANGSVRVLKSLNWVYPKKMDISPDGRFIAYDSFAPKSRGQRDIYLLAADASKETLLVSGPADDTLPLWTPDGRAVVFSSDRLGSNDLWMVPVENGAAAGPPRVLRRNLGRFLPMGVTRAGELYFGVRTGSTQILIAPATGEPKPLASQLAGANSAPAWSRDGQWLAYLTRRSSENFGQESRLLTLRSMKTGEERLLTPKLAHMERISWAPGGKDLLVSGSDGKGRAGIFRVKAADGSVQPVLFDDAAGYRGVPGAWLDDERVVLGGSRLRERNLASGEEKILLDSPVERVAASPDGRVAYAAGGEARILGGGVVAEGDILALEWQGAELLVVKPGGVWRGLRQLDLPGYESGPVAAHPDGSRIAFTAGRVHNEVWVMRLP
jgi:Tol biopolymer transport system component